MHRIPRRAATRSADASAICAAAAALASRGRPTEAIAGYRLALTVAPRCARAHSDLANLLSKQGRIEEAICHMRRAIDCAPERAETYSSLAEILRRKGLTADAAELYAQAAARDRSWAGTRDNLIAVEG